MFDLQEYRKFIATKGTSAESVGFTPSNMPSRLFDHQRTAVDFALGKGRAALFLDTGLGKSGCEAVFADQAAQETGKPSLILTPLAVARQMQRECAAFDVGAEVFIPGVGFAGSDRVHIANYERLKDIDVGRYGAVVLDESSILKSFNGSTKRALVEAFRNTPYRLAATATPAPNDHMEIGQHSEFLGVMPGSEMLTRWFITDQTGMGKYRLKGHARDSFWAWVASWARAASLPSDLGGEDEGFILPPLTIIPHIVGVDLTVGAGDGLFRIPDQSATSIHKEKALTLDERVSTAAQIANAHDGHAIVWCERDDESAALTAAIDGAVEVRGSMKLDVKEKNLEDFALGKTRVMVSKPKLAGFGLNLQRADCQVFSSISHSYEQWYQAIRRSWRFGQKKTVDCHVIMAETETGIWRNVQRKSADHDRMKLAMTRAMAGAQNNAQLRRKYGVLTNIELPEFMKGMNQ